MAGDDSSVAHSPQPSPPAPRLQPPGTPSPPVDSADVVRPWLRAGLALAVLLALVVIFLLPSWVSREPRSVDRDDSARPVPSSDAATDSAARAQAGETLQAYLQQRARLELAHAAVWGEPDWSQAAARANAGDRLFAQRRFADASRSYNDALQRLETLAGARGERFGAALDAGRQALQHDDGVMAEARFGVALAIEPDNAAVAHALARARVRAEVLRLQQAGRDAEAAGNLASARAAYQGAMQRDPEYQPAAAAFERVSQQLVDDGFRAAMSRAFAALDAGRLNEAGSALDEAARLHPADSAMHDARRRLASARLQGQLDRLRRSAAARAVSEDWAAAADLYRQALALDPRVGFARDGLERAQDRARLHRQLDHYLAAPSRLYSAEPLANAERLLAAAGEVPAGEPRLAAKVGQLRGQVTLAHTSVPVELRSDGETTVVIYHVGRLGQFRDHHLDLRPGTYTAVGSRPGYRDARTVFKVQPGAAPLSVDIRCREPF
jgi:hypothetical protein